MAVPSKRSVPGGGRAPQHPDVQIIHERRVMTISRSCAALPNIWRPPNSLDLVFERCAGRVARRHRGRNDETGVGRGGADDHRPVVGAATKTSLTTGTFRAFRRAFGFAGVDRALWRAYEARPSATTGAGLVAPQPKFRGGSAAAPIAMKRKSRFFNTILRIAAIDHHHDFCRAVRTERLLKRSPNSAMFVRGHPRLFDSCFSVQIPYRQISKAG
jgi:hypothetical protein